MNEMYEEILVSAKDDGKSRVLSILLFVIGVIGLAGEIGRASCRERV